MRVLMLLDNAFHPDPRVAAEARSLVAAGHRVTVLAWDREAAPGGASSRPACESWRGVRIERIAVPSRHRRGSGQLLFLGRFWWHAFWRALPRPVDVVHCHDFSTLPAGAALAALKRSALVYDAHESYADMLAANVAPWIKRWVRPAERFLCRRATAAVTVGQALAEELRRRGARRVCVVGNWKRLADFTHPGPAPQEPEASAARLLAENCHLLVVYIGYLNRDRGLLPLLEAVRSLDGVGLLIGGDGVLAEAVRRAAASCWRIHYLGFVDPARIPLYTALSDVVYYGLDPSNPNARYSAPNKLFEALAAGKAVLCNECGEVGRIVRQERCGVVVDPLASHTLRAALGELGDPAPLAACQAAARRAGVERYNWARAESVLLELYRTLDPPPGHRAAQPHP